jgi:hypothetical protein
MFRKQMIFLAVAAAVFTSACSGPTPRWQAGGGATYGGGIWTMPAGTPSGGRQGADG